LHGYYVGLKALNDVAYNIWRGNYRNFLYQIDANATSQGYWRVGSKNQPYGRFARGFNNAQNKNTLYFDIDDVFFCGNALGGRYDVKVRVVYFDKGEGSWALKYHATGNAEKTAYTLTKTNSGQWKEKIVSISDGQFSNGGPRSADLMLVNTDSEDDIFHMVEIIREQGDRRGCWGDGTPCDDGCGTTSNAAPSVALNAPSHNATFTAGESITLTASASDPDGSVDNVVFFSGSTQIGSSTAVPHTVSWSNAPAGTHSLTAKAIDNEGLSRVSSPVTIMVKATSGGGGNDEQCPATTTLVCGTSGGVAGGTATNIMATTIGGWNAGQHFYFTGIDFGSGYDSAAIKMGHIGGEQTVELRTGSASGTLIATIPVTAE
jgi:hypothetical protein